MKKQTKKIKVADLISKTINSRDVVNLLEEEIKKQEISFIKLDFEGVEFISRSAAHALLMVIDRLESRGFSIELVNRGEDLFKMMKVVSKKNKTTISRKNIEYKKVDLESLSEDDLN